MAKTISRDERYELCSSRVTLNGEPAKIGGITKKWASVTVLPNGPSYDWTWDVIARIVAEAGGRFVTR